MAFICQNPWRTQKCKQAHLLLHNFKVTCHLLSRVRRITTMSAVESDCFTIGSIVATKTCYNEDIEGEVLAFDPQTKMLILKSPSSSGNPKRHDVNIVNLSLVSDVQIKKEVTSVPDPPQSLNLNRLTTRVRNSIENKRRLVSMMCFINLLAYFIMLVAMTVHRLIPIRGLS